jgi:hypothetical protein
VRYGRRRGVKRRGRGGGAQLVVDTLPDKGDKIMELLNCAFDSNCLQVVEHAAKTLGNFLRVGGPLTADLADRQV